MYQSWLCVLSESRPRGVRIAREQLMRVRWPSPSQTAVFLKLSTGTRRRRRWNASRKADLLSIPPALLVLEKPNLMSFAQNGTSPQRITPRLRSPALGS